MNPVKPGSRNRHRYRGRWPCLVWRRFDTISRGEKKLFGKFIIFGLGHRSAWHILPKHQQIPWPREVPGSRGTWSGDASTMNDGFSLLRSGPYCTRRKSRTLLCLGTSNQAVQTTWRCTTRFLAASMGALNDNLAIHLPNHRLPYHQSDLPAYKESRVKPRVLTQMLSPWRTFRR